MKKSIVAPALIAALMSSLTWQAAHAQFNARDAFGITTDILRLGIEVNRANAAQEQAAATARQEQRRAAEVQASFYRRVQTALKSLGFYNMAIDGDRGPGTNRAIAAYQAAFETYGDMDEYALTILERHAAEGWRSQSERAAAMAAGFGDRETFIRAQEGGFASATRYEAARTAGFSDSESYSAFERSGASDKVSFEAQLADSEAIAALTEECLAGGDWREVVAICRRAYEASPNDAAVSLALDSALAEAKAGLVENEQRLADAKSELTVLLGGGTESDQSAVRELRVEINALVETNLLVDLNLQAKECNGLIAAQNWEDALPACYSSADIDVLSGAAREQAENLVSELSTHRQAAEQGQAAESVRLAEEAERLALEKAVAESNILLEQIEAFASDGNTFESGVSVARALVDLRSSLQGDNAARITADQSALLSLVDADAAFVAARTALVEAQTRANQSALLSARREAEVLDAFIVSYISANVTSDKIAALLPLSENLSTALESENGEVIIAAQASARKQIDALELTADLSVFQAAYQAPQVSSEAVENAAAAAADAEAAAAQAEQALLTAKANANELLTDVDAFVKAGGKLDDPLSVARAIAGLKSELSNSDLGRLASMTTALSELLDSDTNFVSAKLERQASQGNALANAIALAREDLQAHNEFLLSHISANLTDDAIIDIVNLQVAVEAALNASDSAATVQVRDQTIAGLVELGLDSLAREYADSRQTNTVTAEVRTATNGLSVTPANVALLDGDPGDLLVLRRTDGQAPNLTFNLLGQLAVEGGTANACWVHQAPEGGLGLLMTRRELRNMGVPNLDLVECGNGAEVDLMLMRRAEFIATAPSQALPIVTAYEEGRLEILLTIDARTTDDEMVAIADTTQKLAMAIDNGTARGFGILALPGGTGDICPVVDRLDTHINPLIQRSDDIGFAIAEPSLGKPMQSEAAFASAQRGLCSGVYADAETLKTFINALKNIGVDYAVTTVWVEESEVEQEAVRLANIEAEQIEQAAKRAQQEEAAAAVLAAQTADQRSALEKRQAELRAEYKERADAGFKNITDMVRSMVGTGSSTQLQQWFPLTHGEISGLLHDRWTLTDLSSELSDYGTANWQDRSVDAVLVKVDVQRENALAGAYGSNCFILGWLVDTEFRVNRDAFEASCSDVEALENWRSARSYESVWNLAAD